MTAASLPRPMVVRLRAAQAVLWAELVAVRFWPLAAACAALAGVALLGLPALLPWWLHGLLLLLAAGALGLLGYRAVAGLQAPGVAAAQRRLERDSGLLHRPFAVLQDRPASAGNPHPAQDTLWRLHQARAQAALSGLRLAPPRPDLPLHDRRAWRAAALLLLVAGLVVAGPRAGARLAALLLPGVPGTLAGTAPSVQAWIQPPSYTGLPPVFLAAGGAGPGTPVIVPSGSRLTVSVTGLSSKPTLSLAGRALKVEALGQDSFQAATVLNQGGRLRLGQRFSALAGWTLAVLPNDAPVVAWPAPPGRAGTSLSTKLPWQVQQRWGVAQLFAELRPQNRPDLPALHIPLPLPGTPKQARGAATPDLSADPYAGLTMTGRLFVQDVSGQHGQSPATDFVMPAHTFRHPLARAIADLRRRLALHPEVRGETADELLALAGAPLAQPVQGLPASGVALNLAAAASLLGSAEGGRAAALAEVQGRLWTLALALDGALPDASARALAEARENLRHGIEEHARGKLSDKELGQRLDALRKALDKRLADLAARAMKQGAIQKFDPHTQHLSAPGVDKLVSKLEQALRDGKMDEARQRMAELERLMDQLKNAHIMTPEEQREQQRQARAGRQQMGAVQDMVQRESTLLDHAQARAEPPPPPNALQGLPPLLGLPPDIQRQLGQLPQTSPDSTDDPSQQEAPPAQPPADPAPPPPGRPAPARADDARTQRALHRALDALKDGLAQDGRKKPQSLDEASRAMQDASESLAQSRDPQAREAIARAIAALQQGGQDMARQQGQQSGAGMQLSLEPGGQSGQGGHDEGQDESGDGKGGQQRDPFGRTVDGSGTAADDPDLRVPDEMERGRSRAIQEELRRRGADRARPKGELDYIDRLLKPF